MRQAAVVFGALAIGVGVGYFATPTKVRIETRTVEVVKKQTDKVIVRVKRTTPDGASTTTTTVVDKSVTDKRVDSLKVESSQPDWLVSVMYGTDGGYGAMAQRRILGSVWLGGSVNTRGTGNIILGVSF